jgi:CheY-like chemotaxis protein
VAPSDPGGAAPAHPTALLADDDDDVARVFTRALEGRGFQVRRARTGSEALALIAGLGQVDAAIVDLVLPGAGGLDIVRGLRRAFPACRIVAVTGMDEPAMARAFADAGADTFLPKPVELPKLLAAVSAGR